MEPEGLLPHLQTPASFPILSQIETDPGSPSNFSNTHFGIILTYTMPTRSVPKVMRMIKKKKTFIEHTCNYSLSPSK